MHSEKSSLISESAHRRVMDATDVLLVYLDRVFRFVWVNQAYAATCHKRHEELIGRNHFECYPHAENEAIFQRVVNTGEAVFCKDKPFTFPDQSARGVTYWDWSLVPVKNPAGIVEGLVFSLREITQYKQDQLTLAQSEERFRRLVELTAHMVWTMDSTGTPREDSPSWRAFTGYRLDQWLDSTEWLTAFHPEDRARLRHVWREACASRTPYEVEARLRRADGQYRHIVVRGLPLLNPDGTVRQWVGMNVDITERKEAELTLAQSQKTFFELIERAPFGIYVVDSQFRIKKMNAGSQIGAFKNVRPVIGRDLGEAMRIIWPEPIAIGIIRAFRHTLETGEPYYSPRFTNPRHDVATMESYEWELQRIILPDGDYGVVCYYFNSTTLWQAQEMIRHRAEQFETLLNQAPLGVYLIDEDFCIRNVNPTALSVFGNIPDLIGRDFNDVIHRLWAKDYADEIIRLFRHTLETGEPYETSHRDEYRIDREIREHYEWRIVRITLPEGRYGVVCYFRDISVYVQAQQALSDSTAALERLNTELESRVTERTADLWHSQHQLRDLATELTLTEQRERKRFATELHDHLAQLLALARINLSQVKQQQLSSVEAQALVQQIDDTVSESLNYTHTLIAELSPTVLHDFGLSAALRWLGEHMRRYNLSVTVDASEDKLPVAEDEAVLLFQSVRELLINASKHAKTHRASITVRHADDQLCIEVHDQGVGFDRRLSDQYEVSAGSSKFGLFSIRERMKALGGSLLIDSEPGKGTTATLVLPLQNQIVPLSGTEERLVPRPLEREKCFDAFSQAASDNSARLRLVLVDDHAMVRQGLRSVLTSYPDIHVIGEASNGHEAVELTERLKPAVVVMDINMPHMNGIKATAIIKGRHPEIIVIGLSVNAAVENQDAMKTAGASMVLPKEAAVGHLYGAIQTATKMKASSAENRQA